MRGLRRVCCMWLIVALALSFTTFRVFADDPKPDTDKQNAITMYALSFEGNVDVQYVWGGYGGRQYSYNGESGENNGYWSLEQCIKYIDEWSTNPEDNAWKPYGTDCSGFVSAVFSHFGIYTPSVVSGFADGRYEEVPEDEAVPGDVLCYYGYDSSTDRNCWAHAGLYLGDDLIIHVNTRYGYSGRTTPYGGHMTSERKSTPTYPHISREDYWSSAERHYFRVVDDWSEYGVSESEQENIQTQINSAIIPENELEGMVMDSPISKEALDLMMPDRTGLSQFEKNNMSSIKDKLSDDIGTDTIINGAFSFIGLLLILYGVLLSGGFVFDRVNSFIDISFVGLFTFGALSVVSSEEYKELVKQNKEKGKVTPVKLLTVCCVMVIVGSLCISGILLSTLYKVVYYFI